MTRDHMLGHAAAAREDFEAPAWWDAINRYPLGVPARMRDAWGNDTCGCSEQRERPVATVTRESVACMTQGDVDGWTGRREAQGLTVETHDGVMCLTQPEPCGQDKEPAAAPCVNVAQGSKVGTLSPAAEWPYETLSRDQREHEQRCKEQAAAIEHQQRIASRQAMLSQGHMAHGQISGHALHEAMLLGRCEPQVYEASMQARYEQSRALGYMQAQHAQMLEQECKAKAVKA